MKTEKIMLCVVGILFCSILLGLFYTVIMGVGRIIDHNIEEKKCTNEAISRIDIERENYILSCYANNEFWKINFGHNIDCECFFTPSETKLTNYMVFHIV